MKTLMIITTTNSVFPNHGFRQHFDWGFPIRRSGTAWCALGSFGGGFLGGDEVDVDVHMEKDTVLTMTTQVTGGWEMGLGVGDDLFRTKINFKVVFHDSVGLLFLVALVS